jgi:catechol-2,3-dioxygenase
MIEHEAEIDRHAIWVNDLVRAERFYGEILGEIIPSYVANRYMLSTEEIIRERQLQRLAERRGEVSKEFPIPYSRAMVGQADIIFRLLDHHVQEPLVEQLQGTPRIALRVSEAQIEQAVEVFTRHRVPFKGPVDHASPSPIARSIYFKDPSGNFLELACRR